jgi:hypothetical protein
VTARADRDDPGVAAGRRERVVQANGTIVTTQTVRRVLPDPGGVLVTSTEQLKTRHIYPHPVLFPQLEHV